MFSFLLHFLLHKPTPALDSPSPSLPPPLQTSHSAPANHPSSKHGLEKTCRATRVCTVQPISAARKTQNRNSANSLADNCRQLQSQSYQHYSQKPIAMTASSINAQTLCSVLVRVSGPDPTERKTKGRAFFTATSGTTTISVSGHISAGLADCTSRILVLRCLVDSRGQPCRRDDSQRWYVC